MVTQRKERVNESKRREPLGKEESHWTERDTQCTLREKLHIVNNESLSKETVSRESYRVSKESLRKYITILNISVCQQSDTSSSCEKAVLSQLKSSLSQLQTTRSQKHDVNNGRISFIKVRLQAEVPLGMTKNAALMLMFEHE